MSPWANTSVLVALLRRLPSPQFRPALSVALHMEWQALLTRPEHLPPGMNAAQMSGLLRYLASLAHLQDVHYLWRPFLRDPDDDMVLECAVASSSRFVVTHDVKDFRRARELGVHAISPAGFLQHLEALP